MRNIGKLCLMVPLMLECATMSSAEVPDNQFPILEEADDKVGVPANWKLWKHSDCRKLQNHTDFSRSCGYINEQTPFSCPQQCRKFPKSNLCQDECKS